MATAPPLIVAALGLVAAAPFPVESPATSSGHHRVVQAVAPAAWALDASDRLPPDEQVGQLLLGSFDGPQAPRSLTRALRSRQLSGVILFGSNVRSAGQLRGLTRGLQRAAARGALISVDQEGGLVRRIPFAAPRPGQPKHGSPARVRRIARQAARDLKALGVNVNFAPVADVPSPGSDIRQRAFTGSAGVVGQKVAAATAGYRSGRVAAAAKHFPGLGSAPRNTDDSPVVIRRTRARLRGTDLVPFRAAFKAQVPLVMVSHATYSALDRRHLASQSARVLKTLLRNEMRYEGAVVTDALEARAVLRRSSVAVAAERSLVAGSDLLLLTRPSSFRSVRARLLDRARRSARLRARIREAAARVLVLKRSLGLRIPPALQPANGMACVLCRSPLVAVWSVR